MCVVEFPLMVISVGRRAYASGCVYVCVVEFPLMVISVGRQAYAGGCVCVCSGISFDGDQCR